MKIQFNKPLVGEEEAVAAANAIKSGWITTAKYTEEAEKKLAD